MSYYFSSKAKSQKNKIVTINRISSNSYSKQLDGQSEQMVFVQLRSCSGEWDAQTCWEIQTGHLISVRWQDLVIKKTKKNKKQKKKTCRFVDLTVSKDYWVKLKESEGKDKYLNLARELKNLRNMKVTVIPVVIGALGTVTKGLVQGLKDLHIGVREDTILSTALLRSARILRSVLETWGDLLSLKFQCEKIG